MGSCNYIVMMFDSDEVCRFPDFYKADMVMRLRYKAHYCRITEEETVWYGPDNQADTHSLGPVIAWHNNKGQSV